MFAVKEYSMFIFIQSWYHGDIEIKALVQSNTLYPNYTHLHVVDLVDYWEMCSEINGTLCKKHKNKLEAIPYRATVIQHQPL